MVIELWPKGMELQGIGKFLGSMIEANLMQCNLIYYIDLFVLSFYNPKQVQNLTT